MVKITDTTLRDGQQSLIATRMRIEEMEPVFTMMDEIGFHSLEVWGGATFDTCLRYLNEDPWERLRKMRKAFKNTKLQMLFRGQNMLAYKAFPDDVVEMFIRKSVENGIDILRIFDALNDLRNIETSVKAVKKEKAHAQLCISYTLSDVHTMKYFLKLANELKSMGADSICIKDMAGLLLPGPAYELVKGIKEQTKLPVQVHSHYTSGMAAMTYMKAVEAGADIIDCAMSPFALGTSQPATEVMVVALKGSKYDTKIDETKFSAISEHLKVLREKALDTGLMSMKVLGVDVSAILYQVPGGMLSNLVSQLKMQNAEDKYEEVLNEIPKVRADLGYPPLVTPTSQIVGTQAVLNVLTGERYKSVTTETKDLVRGMYGKTPVPINAEIQKKIIGSEKPITCRPADLLKPKLKEAREEIKDFIEQEEDILSYILFPQVAKSFFEYRQAQKYKADPVLYDKVNNVYPV